MVRHVRPSLTPVRRALAGRIVRGPERSAHWYNTPRWRQLRRLILERDGWVCRQTGVLLIGRYPAADSPVVDHIVPHRGDQDLFWDEGNLQAVCKGWHDSEKQRQERAAQRQAGGVGRS